MIVGASVAVKWLVEEPWSAKASRLLARDDLAAPDLLDVEIGQAVSRLARQRLLPSADAARLFAAALSMPVKRRPWRGYAQDAFDLSLRLRATFNDCLYLALALSHDEPLVTADERFLRSARTDPSLGSAVLSLADLPD